MRKNARKTSDLKHPPYYKFRNFLDENKIKQYQIAELLSISPVTVNQKINGSLDFTFTEVEKICDTYSISPEVFLTKKVAS